MIRSGRWRNLQITAEYSYSPWLFPTTIAVMKLTITAIVLVQAICRIYCADSSGFQVNVNDDGTYSVLVNGVTWLRSGDTLFRGDKKSFYPSNGSLKKTVTTTANGTDQFGHSSSTTFTYEAGAFHVNATVKVYTQLPAAIFTQTYLEDATDTAASSLDDVISSFPNFNLHPNSQNLGFLVFSGNMGGYTRLAWGRLNDTRNLHTGISAGPLVIFDSSSNAVVISPASQFMAASNHINSNEQIGWGIMGGVNHVPRHYSISFIVHYSNRGINQAIQDWGKHLTTLYKKTRERRDNDLTIKYMGYWTDNGGYYYYNTEHNKNYEATIVDVADHIKNLSIPFKYLQFDSWWYLKGKNNGTKTWEPRSDVLPNGFRALSEKTKLPFGCHNRFWDAETTYAKQNGGLYNFIIDSSTGFSVPNDSKFWHDLFNETQTWGEFILYEQDWLDKETYGNPVLEKDSSLGRQWLLQMGQGAESVGKITIQYCMSYSRHLLQSLEIPVVTQARVSADYKPGNHQWNIGITSILADALNVAPFKDTFWTTMTQPGNPYNSYEPNTKLQALVSTLSTGPVGPGDGIGFINTTLLMKCCDASGLILKPDKPATAIDDQIKLSAFGSPYPGPDGNVYTTYSNISGIFFGIVVVIDLKSNYSLVPASAWPTIQFPPSLAFPESDPYRQYVFANNAPLHFDNRCTARYFCLFYTSELIGLDSGDTVAILGELDKWVPTSQQRVNSIQQTGADVLVRINVQAMETVNFSIYVSSKNEVKTIVCDNSKSSTPAFSAVISVVSGKCTVK